MKGRLKIKRYLFAALGLILVLVAFWNSFNFGSKPNNLYTSTDTILVAAHRGSHTQYPENSLAAIEESIKNGIDIVEVDIRKTKDNKLILLHDPALDRTSTGTGLATGYSLEEIKGFRLLFDNQTTVEKIPTLKEALREARGKVILNLDFKVTDIETIKQAYRLISDLEMEESVLISLKNIELISSLHDYNPMIRIMPVVYSKRKIRKVLKYDFIDIIQVYHHSYPRNIINKLKDRDISIWVNALGKYDKLEAKNKSGFEKLIRVKKADVIQTDYPEALLKYLRRNDLHP